MYTRKTVLLSALMRYITAEGVLKIRPTVIVLVGVKGIRHLPHLHLFSP